MATNLPIDCGICQEGFDEDQRIPRLLPCFHRLCSQCITALIANRQTEGTKCPFCRRQFLATSCRDLTADTSFLELLVYVKNMQETSCTPGKLIGNLEILPHEHMRESCEKHIVVCRRFKTAGEKIKLKLNSLEREIMRSIINREGIRKWMKGTEDVNKRHLADLLKKRELLEDTLQLIGGGECQLVSIQKELSARTNYTDAGPLIDEKLDILKKNEDALRVAKTHLADCLTILHRCKKENKNIAEKLTNITNILNSDDEEENEEEEQEELENEEISSLALEFLSVCLRHNPDDISVAAFLRLGDSVIQLIQEGRIVAFQDPPTGRSGIRRYARISINQDKSVFLHYLKEGQVPDDVYLLKHEDLLTGTHSRLTFLDFSLNQERLGRVQIQLKPRGNYPLNFIKMCTGEKGPSYTCSNVLHVTTKEFHFGDYETNDGSGGKSVVAGVNWQREGKRDIYKEGWRKAGSVAGLFSLEEKTASQFLICTRDDYRETPSFWFGTVVKGLDILSGITISYGTDVIKRVVISDCGIVLRQ